MPALLQITGTVVGAEQVAARLGTQIPAEAVSRMRGAVRSLGYLLEAKVKGEYLNGLALHRRSGRLSRSINTQFLSGDRSETAAVGTNVSYGRIWELTGSRAYTITAKNKKALFWPGAKHPVRSVFHPAQAPRPFLKPALNAMRPTIRATLQAAMAHL